MSDAVYRPYTSIIFHASILHVVFNMLALVPIGSGLERMLGSVRYLHVLFLMATSNALIEIVIAYLAAYNPVHPYRPLLHECGIGFSGVIFAMIVMETNLNAVQTRRYALVFGIRYMLPWKYDCLRQFDSLNSPCILFVIIICLGYWVQCIWLFLCPSKIVRKSSPLWTFGLFSEMAGR